MYNKYVYDFKTRPYLTTVSRISFLQRVVIIHSILYYEYNNSIKTDVWFDTVCKQLVDEMFNATDKQNEQSQYYYCMYDFDGTTGYDIYSRLSKEDREYLTLLALKCLESSNSTKTDDTSAW